MDANEFARIYLTPYSVKGDEIVPTYCPYCKGGERKDKYTFALNTRNLTFNCKRGSCGKQGRFADLCRDFGVSEQKEYTRPKTKLQKAPDAVKSYLESRGISAATQDSYRVCADESGNVAFPFLDEKEELVFLKFRPVGEVKKGERKSWREKGTMPILFGMHLCDPSQPLAIFEGEIDAMSGHESGIPNCVSVPSGSEDLTWLDTCWEFLERYDDIYLYGDNDTPGKKMVEALALRLNHHAIHIVEHECKDANELLCTQGKTAVLEAYLTAREVPPYGLIQLADVEPMDMAKMPKALSGIKELDKAIGGFLFGDLSVWTGRRGEGKSTLLSQICAESVDAGIRVCIYSGELRADRFQHWFHLQIAGSDYIKSFLDSSGKTINYVPKPTAYQIREWYRGRVWIYDNTISESGEEDSIINAFELAAKRYGCQVFLVDNLMTARYAFKSENGYYRAQSEFVGRLVEFANRYNVHVHLVAHPRKNDGGLKNDDVAGTADITNRASNVFSLERVDVEDQGRVGCDAVLSVLKNRWYGAGAKIGLDFDEVSRRYYVPSVGNKKVFGWVPVQARLRPIEEDSPF